MTTAPELPEQSAFLRSLGLGIDEASGTRVTAWIDAGPQHHQPHGVVHGGVYCSVIETVTSYGGHLAVAEGGQTVVGISNSTDFLRPHRVGRLRVVAEPLQQGRTLQLWQVVISREDDDKVVARGQVRLANIERQGG